MILHHNDFKTNNGKFEETYTAPRCCKIVEEESTESFFIDESEVDNSNKNNNKLIEGTEGTEGTEASTIKKSINARGGVVDNDMIQIRGRFILMIVMYWLLKKFHLKSQQYQREKNVGVMTILPYLQYGVMMELSMTSGLRS